MIIITSHCECMSAMAPLLPQKPECILLFIHRPKYFIVCAGSRYTQHLSVAFSSIQTEYNLIFVLNVWVVCDSAIWLPPNNENISIAFSLFVIKSMIVLLSECGRHIHRIDRIDRIDAYLQFWYRLYVVRNVFVAPIKNVLFAIFSRAWWRNHQDNLERIANTETNRIEFEWESERAYRFIKLMM